MTHGGRSHRGLLVIQRIHCCAVQHSMTSFHSTPSTRFSLLLAGNSLSVQFDVKNGGSMTSAPSTRFSLLLVGNSLSVQFDVKNGGSMTLRSSSSKDELRRVS